jgi:hypothetical protein
MERPCKQSLCEMGEVRCAFFDRNFHSRMPLVPTPARLMLLHACDQWHSSRVFAHLTGSHCKLRPNTEGTWLGHGSLLVWVHLERSSSRTTTTTTTTTPVSVTSRAASAPAPATPATPVPPVPPATPAMTCLLEREGHGTAVRVMCWTAVCKWEGWLLAREGHGTAVQVVCWTKGMQLESRLHHRLGAGLLFLGTMYGARFRTEFCTR